MSRDTIRIGAKGNTVTELQTLLNEALSLKPPIKKDGDFGKKTLEAVIAFQRSANLKTDGIVGSATWGALVQATSHKLASPTSAITLADIASKYVGVTETDKNRAGSSKKLLEIFEADDLVVKGKTDGYPWCASFVSLCVQKLCKSSTLYHSLVPPREPSVSRFLDIWARDNNCMIFSPSSKVYRPTKGDIVVFTFSHIGIVESNRGAVASTIEGNTNAAGGREGVTVARKTRSHGIVKSFIRLPMTPVGIEMQLKKTVQYC